MKKLPCPRCGKLKRLSVRQMNRMLNPREWETGWEVRCGNCCMSSGIAQTKEEAIEVWNVLPRYLQWTTERPTEVGWYWREQGYCEPTIVKVTDRNLGWGEKCLAVDGETRDYFLTCNAQWAGPIPRPR